MTTEASTNGFERAASDDFIEYFTKDGSLKKIRLHDGYLYQVVPKSRLDKILKDGKISPVKVDHNFVPLVEPLSSDLASKGKVFFTPSPDISSGLATGTNYGGGIINRIDAKALKGMKIYHDPHVSSDIPSFYVTDPIDAQFVNYSVNDGQKYLSYTKVAASLKDLPTQVKILVKVQQELDDFFKTTKPTLQDGMTIGFNLGRDQVGGPAVTTGALFEIKSANKALQTISLKAAKKSLLTTNRDLEKIIGENFKVGGSAKDLAGAISDKFNQQYLGRRSFLVARTEGTGVLNAGTQEQMVEDGVSARWWAAQLDGRQRKTHEDVMAETQDDPIPLTEPFKVGEGEGMFPGDPSLPIEERANCRCRIVNADLGAVRCAYYTRLFLRSHGSLERKLQQAVNVYFRRMLSRITSRTESIKYPYST